MQPIVQRPPLPNKQKIDAKQPNIVSPCLVLHEKTFRLLISFSTLCHLMLTAHGSLDFLRLLQFCSHTMTGFLFLLFSLVVDINNDLSQDDVKEVNENCLIQREGHRENGQNAV